MSLKPLQGHFDLGIAAQKAMSTQEIPRVEIFEYRNSFVLKVDGSFVNQE